MGDGAAQQPTVANPAVEDLQNLRSLLVKEVGRLNDSLRTTCSDMGGKKVWVGRTADGWTSEVTGRRHRIQTLVGKLIPIVDAEIKKLPAKVTPGDAKMYRIQ